MTANKQRKLPWYTNDARGANAIKGRLYICNLYVHELNTLPDHHDLHAETACEVRGSVWHIQVYEYIICHSL